MTQQDQALISSDFHNFPSWLYFCSHFCLHCTPFLLLHLIPSHPSPSLLNFQCFSEGPFRDGFLKSVSETSFWRYLAFLCILSSGTELAKGSGNLSQVGPQRVFQQALVKWGTAPKRLSHPKLNNLDTYQTENSEPPSQVSIHRMYICVYIQLL